ncbi:MAG: polyketide synthase dehydratase domain-containing protein [Desulfobulbaceae bacterium]|nr:polyketide synthase dehydratase domain-containing protein [Desulfobulbaceae bacterium]
METAASPSQAESIAAPGGPAGTTAKAGDGSAVSPAASITAAAAQKLLLDLVSEKTGYPPEMLDLDQNLEADLGIDSIKRVEILGALARHLGQLSENQAESLNRLTTLRQIIDAIARMNSAPESSPAEPEIERRGPVACETGIDGESVRQALLDLVSEKTGYPAEMIGMDQKLEADLGIDSIKRVEILGAFAKQFGALPEAEAEKLNRLQTLQEIVDFLTIRLAESKGNGDSLPQSGESQEEISAEEPEASAAYHRLPFSGRILQEEPGREVTLRYDIDLNKDMFLAHHTLGGSVSREDASLLALPVMPFNMTAEIMAEGASILFPGKFPVAMENLLARDWIILEEERVFLTVQAKVLPGSPRASAQLFIADAENEGSGSRLVAEGIFSFAETFPAGQVAKPFHLKNSVACSISPENFYPEALFHGPAFQVIDSIAQCSDDGVEAILKRPASNGLFANVERPRFLTDPVLLDGAGQVVGLWAAQNLADNYVVFPVALQSAYFYSSPLTPGSGFNCRTRSGSSAGTITSRIEITAGRQLYARLEGLQHKRIDMPEILHHFRGSRQVMLSSDWDGPLEPFANRDKMACRRIDTAAGLNFSGADGRVMRSVIAHIILNSRERRQWHGLKGPETRKTEWLLGRLAAKEAVRTLLKKMAAPDVWSADIEITADKNGKPFAAGKWLNRIDWIPLISLTHSNGTAAAVAAAGTEILGIGIDLEPVRHMDADFQEFAFTQEELSIISKNGSHFHHEWSVRLWCAKEAAGKALGRGMPGGPKDILATEIQPETGVIHLKSANELQGESPGSNTAKLAGYTLRENDSIVALSIYPSTSTGQK